MEGRRRYGKAVTKKAAWEVATERGVELAVVNPVQGPLLQPTVNASVVHILKYLNDSAKTYSNAVHAYVDVRDVAEVYLLVFEAPEAKGSRNLGARPQELHHIRREEEGAHGRGADADPDAGLVNM